ncbi:MAG: PepSY domain-containing protein, partial [Candidatus Obscuribacterales bacterium]|nr:PepSY domain-containing protein [Steroidobacteraceae bacterium]
MTIRKSIFWLHLGSGLTAGIIVAIMSATGVAIAFEAEILQWIDRDVRTVVVPANATPLTLDQLDAAVKEKRPDLKVTSRIVPREPDEAYEFRAGRDGAVYVNPYTAAVTDPASKGAHDFLHVLQDWHRRLGMEGDNREVGKLITGVANFAFLFLCITGVYMWWPRSWSPKAWRPAIWFVGRIKGRARDFNWHNVFGCWSAIVLTVIVASGVVMSFGWAHRLVFKLAGEEAPQQRGPGMLAGPQVNVLSPNEGEVKLSRDAVLAQVAKDYPQWESIAFDSLPPPKDASVIQPLNVVVFNPAPFQTRGRVQLNIDPFR